MAKVCIFFTTVASDITKNMLLAWLDGWEIPYKEGLEKEEEEILEEHGFLKWNDFYKTYVEGEKFISGDYEVEMDNDKIICLFGDEADIVNAIKILPRNENETETVEDIIKDFHEIEKILCK